MEDEEAGRSQALSVSSGPEDASRKGSVMSGPKAVRQYESKFAEWFGADYAFAFWKGRVALYAILKAMGIGSGDEILLPGYTCVMNVNPIKYLGAKPIYVDIEPTTYNIDATLLRDRISPNTKAIIAQHTYGYPCDMDSVMDIAASSSIPVIEDCCLALGSRYKGKMVGTLGRAAYFSFQWNKPYTTGMGGMAITSDADLAQRIEALRSSEMCAPSIKEVAMLWAQLVAHKLFVYPRTTALIQRLFRYLTKKGLVVGSSSPREFVPAMDSDFFKAMSTVQARLGLRQLKKIEQNLAHRKKAAQLYDRLLEQKGWPARKYDSLTMEPVMVRYPVRIAEKNKALAESATAGIELGSWFECPLHPIETPLAAYDYTEGLCPESEKASREVVNLPLHHRVDEETAHRTVDFITRFAAAP
jgi:dTDP-4-amino-4,6-dideoxygalactose transaminase